MIVLPLHTHTQPMHNVSPATAHVLEATGLAEASYLSFSLFIQVGQFLCFSSKSIL